MVKQTISLGSAILILFGLCSLTVSAEYTKGIKVSGSGQILVKPNIAVTQFRVIAFDDSVAKARNTANKENSQIIEKIKRVGVTDDDMQVQLDFPRRPPRTDPKDKGYAISTEVKIRDLADLGAIAEIVMGAMDKTTIYFDIDNPAQYIQKARDLAINNALEKAKQLALAAHVFLGDVLSIVETGPEPSPSREGVSLPKEAMAEKLAELDSNYKISIVSNVDVVYDIGPIMIPDTYKASEKKN